MRATTVGVWLLLALIGGALFLREAPRAFPEANLRFQVSRQEALTIAEQALRTLVGSDLSLDGWRRSVVFSADSNAKWYLEKTLGLEQADQVMREQVAVWYYVCRWVKEGERTTYTARVSPEGRVVGVSIEIPEEMPGAQLPKEQALQVAVAFIRDTLQTDMQAWRFHSDYEYQRPQRKDYAFVWEHRTLRYPADSATPATVRMTVRVLGDKVLSYYLNWLHTPEKWHFEQERNESLRNLVQGSAETVYLVFQIALIGVIVWLLVKRQLMALKPVLWIALLVAVASLAGALNSIPLWWADYSPASAEATFIISRFALTLVGAFFFTGIVTLLWVMGADALSRERPPAGIRLALVGTSRFWTTRETLQALFVGLCFGLLHLGYVVVFYRVALMVGAWVPLQVPYTNAVATPFPFLEPLLIGLQPALWEEVLFRVAILYMVWRVTRQLWLSILLSSALWAFLHTNYPVDPVYLRGVELLPVGVMFAWIAFRYGILSAIAAHYTYNALLSAYTFWQMYLPYLRWSALIVGFGVVLLFIPALFTYLRTRSLPSVSELGAPQELHPPQPTQTEVPVQPYRPLQRFDWVVASVLAVALAGVDWFRSRQPDHISLAPLIKTTRAEAEQKAWEYLRAKGVNLVGYQTYVYFIDNRTGRTVDYLREQVGKPAVAQFLTTETVPAYWSVRFFKPGEREEWVVSLTLEGQVWSYSAFLPEEKAGARLSESEARRVAEAYLAQERRIARAEWRLIESDRTERPNRYDYTFVYEHQTKRYGEAPLRLSVGVLGDIPVGPTQYLEIPEKWFFERRQFRSWTILGGVWGLALLIPFTFYLLYLSWRTGTISSFSWRLGLKVALLALPLLALDQLNRWEQTLWADYDTSTPLHLHYSQVLSFAVVGVLVLAVLAFAIYGGMEPQWWRYWVPFLVPLSVWLSPRQWYFAPPESPLRHPLAMRQAFGIAYLIACGMLVGAFFLPSTPSFEVRSYSLDAFQSAGTSVFLWGLLGLMAISLHAVVVRTWQRWLIGGLLFAPVSVIGASSWYELQTQLLTYWGWFLALLIGGYWLSRRGFQGNLFGWAALFYLAMLAPDIPSAWITGIESLRWDGMLLVGFFLLPIALLAWIERVRARIPAELTQAVVSLPAEASTQATPVPETEE